MRVFHQHLMLPPDLRGQMRLLPDLPGGAKPCGPFLDRAAIHLWHARGGGAGAGRIREDM